MFFSFLTAADWSIKIIKKDREPKYRVHLIGVMFVNECDRPYYPMTVYFGHENRHANKAEKT